ncbi:MAG TPA: nucleoside recognition domain-containing protein, partial [Pseudomonadales bacterium]|nr:nucleoside recognition domain-containing protein [Pseudomonadales bacterium]
LHATTFSLMARMFDGQIGAFAYVLFVLLYMPCVATLGALHKEIGGFWAFFSATWNTVIAYTLAVIVYQGGTFAAHPLASALWIAGCLVALASSYAWLMYLGEKRHGDDRLIPVINI